MVPLVSSVLERLGSATPRESVAKNRLLIVGIIAFVVVLGGWLIYAFTQPESSTLWPVDLAVYRDGGLIVRQLAPYNAKLGARPFPLYDWTGAGNLNFTYTPFAALFFAAVSFIPWSVLPRIVQVANLIFLFIAAWCTMGGLGYKDRRVRLGGALLGVAAGLLTEPVFRTLYLGQINLLLMAAIIWDLRQPETRRFKGIATGLAAGIKLTPLVFIPYLLLARKWRAAAVTTGSFVFTVLLGFLILPRDSKAWWFNGLFISDGRTGFPGWTGNQSLRGIATRLAGSINAATVPWVIVVLIVTVVGLLVAAQLDRAGHPMLGLLTAALVGLLDSPISWDHHWVWVVPAMMAAGHYAARAWQARKRAAAYWCSGADRRAAADLRAVAGQPVGRAQLRSRQLHPGPDLGRPLHAGHQVLPLRRPALLQGIPLDVPAGPGGQRLHPGRHRPARPADGGGPAVPPPGGPRPPLRPLLQQASPDAAARPA